MSKVQGKKRKVSKPSLVKGFGALLSGRFLTKEYVQANLLFIFYIVALMVGYIAYGYFAEQNVKNLLKAEEALGTSKSRNLAVNARLESTKQQSNLAETAAHMGLRELRTPPVVIRRNNSKPKK